MRGKLSQTRVKWQLVDDKTYRAKISSYDQWYITKKFETWYKIILGFASKVYIEIENF